MVNLDLFGAPPAQITPASWPTPGTQTDKALAALLSGQAITQADYRHSWRLAAYVERLRQKGWAIASRLIQLPGWSAHIAEYRLDRSDPATAAALKLRRLA